MPPHQEHTDSICSTVPHYIIKEYVTQQLVGWQSFLVNIVHVPYPRSPEVPEEKSFHPHPIDAEYYSVCVCMCVYVHTHIWCVCVCVCVCVCGHVIM